MESLKASVKWFTFLFIIIISTSSLQAAVVHLNDGSQMEGTVVSATAREIKLHTAGGVTTISTDRISSIEYGDFETPAPPPGRRRYRRQRAIERARSVNLNITPEQMFSVDLGFATPISDVDFASAGGSKSDNGDTGILLGAQYLYYLTRRLGAGMNFEFFNRSTSNSRSLLPGADTRVFGNTVLIQAAIRYTIVPRGSARPYLMVGLGPNRTTTVIESQPLAGFVWSDTATDETRALVDESKWGLATTARLGIDFWANAPASFNFEIGWTGISNGRYDANPAGQDLGLTSVTGTLNVLTMAARWGWRF